MPTPVQFLLLALLGAAIGSFINWAIYQWAITMHRPISPWMKPRPDYVSEENAEKLRQLQPRTWIDCIPIYGWFGLRRDASILGTACWFRPLLIELTWMIGLPVFFLWQHAGGLIGVDPVAGLAARVPPGFTATPFANLATVWFWLHAILIALMFIATFIDFDEQMIPDQVTVPGTILALVAAAIFCESRLPITLPTKAMLPSLAHIDVASPATAGTWYAGTAGLLTCLGILAIWVWGLLPKLIPSGDFKLGFFGSLKMMMASMIRPRRKTACELRTTPRQMSFLAKLYLGILIVGVFALLVAWTWLGPANKLSLVSAFLGLAISGGLIWGIRIVGRLALGQEAMGFGDVTLMAMVGTFIGWQASLAAFVYGIMIAMLAVIVMVIFIRNSHIAFGPYLSMGTVAAVYNWSGVWQGARQSVFVFGPFLLLVLAASLIGMVILLPIVRWLKGLLFRT